MSEIDETYLGAKKNQADRSRDKVWEKMLNQNTFNLNEPTEPSGPEPKAAEQEKPSWLRSLLKETWEGTKALPETTATLATGMVAWPISLVGGIGMTIAKGAEEGKAFEQFLQEKYTYQPKSEAAQTQAEPIGWAMETINKPAQWVGDVYSKITGSEAGGYFITKTGEVVTLILIPKVGKAAKKLVVKPKPFEGPVNPLDIATAQSEIQMQKEGSAAMKAAREKNATPPIGPAADTLLAERLRAETAQPENIKIMEDLAQRAHDEVQAALEKIPSEEWAKVTKSGKAIDMEDMAGVIRRGIDRLETAAEETPKLPEVYKRVIEKEKADLESRAKNLENIAKEADQVGQELIVIPEVLTPRETVRLETPKPPIAEPGKVGAAPTPSGEVIKKQYPGLAYNYEKEISGTEGKTLFESAIEDHGFKIESITNIGKGKKEIIYNDGKNTKYAYSRWRMIQDGAYEDSIVSPKRIPSKYLDVLFDEAGKSTDIIQNKILKEAQGDPNNIVYWVQKISDEVKEHNQAVIKKYGGDFNKAYDSPEFKKINYYEEAQKRLQEYLKLPKSPIAEPGKVGEVSRPMVEIAKDLKTILDLNEKGAVGDLGPLTPDKQMAYIRLKKDFALIARNAQRTGKSIENYLSDLGIDKELIAYMVRESQAEKQAELPPGAAASTAAPTTPPGAGNQPKPSPGVPPEPVPAEVRINLDRIIADDAVKQVVADLDAEIGATPSMQKHRAVQSHERTISRAERVTVSQLLKIPDTTKDLAPQITALRDEVNRAATRVEELQRLAESGDQAARNQIIPMSLVAGELIRRQEIGSRNIARALEAHKIGSEEVRAKIDYSGLADLAESYRNAQNIDPDIFINRLRGLVEPEQKATFFKQLVSGLKKGTDIFNFAWINGLLSGLPTHVVNLASSTLNFMGAVVERESAATIGQVGRLVGRKPGVQFGEGGQVLYGAIDGFMDALQVAKKAWIENEPQFGGSKARKTEIVKNPLSQEALGTSGAFGRSLEFIGNVIGGPGRAMMTADEFMKGINYRGELRARAYREASMEGLTGDAFGKRVKYIIDHPDEFEGIHEAAQKFALEQTFNAEMGQIGRGFVTIANATPITKVILPFVRTPTNIIKYSQARTPILNLASKRFWEDIGKGGADAELALGKMSTGIMAVAAIMTLADAGLITGSGPRDPKMKKIWMEEKQPWSVKVGDTWIAYDRMDPWGNVVGSAAEAVNLINDLELEDSYQIFSALALAAANIYVNKTYLKGANDFIAAVRNPDAGAKDYIKQWSRSLAPAILRTVNRAFFDDQVREVNGVMEAIQASVPGWSTDLPVKRGFWGQPVIPEGSLGPDVLSPYRITTQKADPVNQEIIRNKMSLSMPSRSIGGIKPSDNPLVMEKNSWGVKLSPTQYDRFVQLARAEPILNGQNAKEAVGDLINKTSYLNATDGPEGSKALMIREVLNKYETMAVYKLREEFPDLAKQIDDRRKTRREALRPGYEPPSKGSTGSRFLNLFQ